MEFLGNLPLTIEDSSKLKSMLNVSIGSLKVSATHCNGRSRFYDEGIKTAKYFLKKIEEINWEVVRK